MVQEGIIEPSSSAPSSSHPSSQSSQQRTSQGEQQAAMSTTSVPAKAHVVTSTPVVPGVELPPYPTPSYSASLPQTYAGAQRPTSTVEHYGTGVTSTPLYPTPTVPQHHQHTQQPAAVPSTANQYHHSPPTNTPTVPSSHPTTFPPPPQATSGASVSGGQFYSRRMGGSYDY